MDEETEVDIDCNEEGTLFCLRIYVDETNDTLFFAQDAPIVLSVENIIGLI